MKKIVLPLLFLGILIASLFLVNLIPRNWMYDNISSSVKYYNDVGFKSYLNDSMAFMNDCSADATAMNVMYNTSDGNVLYNSLVVPMYREFEHQDFMKMSYETVINNKEANYNYNRYWHGYQVLWKPLLIFFNANTIQAIMLVGYIALLTYMMFSCIKEKLKLLGISLCLMNVLYIVPFGFTALEYIPVFYITIISCILLIKDKFDPIIILSCSGIATAFFDFLTSETLAVTVPLLCYLYLNKTNLKFFNVVKLGISWLIGYCGTFLFKWTFSSVLYGENFIKIAFEKYATHKSIFDSSFGLKFNVNTLFFNSLKVDDIYMVLSIALIIICFIVYLYRKESTSVKYLWFVFVICLIPYIRYLVLAGHSIGFMWFTYRAQLVLIPALVLVLSEIDFKLVGRRKK